MNGSSFLFFDANTLWHKRLVESLGEVADVTAFLPRSGCRIALGKRESFGSGRSSFVPLTLPWGWASTVASFVQPWLAGQVIRRFATLQTVAILASPAYRVLARHMRGHLPYVYYGTDDYRSYVGWGHDTAIAEAEICRGAMLSIFVSESLRSRAIREYGLPPNQTFVSPNATEPRFLGPADVIPELLIGRPRPVLGILGALTDRLDLNLIRSATQLPQVGSLLIAGPVHPDIAHQPWLSHPKLVVSGKIPHEQMHSYALSMDAALIPYSATRLNYHCSPLRMYDHLATGVPIFAADTCDQIKRKQASGLMVRSPAQLVKGIESHVGDPRVLRRDEDLFWSRRAQDLNDSITAARAEVQRRTA
ncbi:MAG: hypothetical protein AAGB13_01475 [Cyanobacteria bacterium P01_F01_bin.33]